MSPKVLTTLIAGLIARPASADCWRDERLPFTPIDGEATTLSDQWKIPPGYGQRVIADEVGLDIFPGHDWTDMNTVNEGPGTPDVGRYLYRTHEITPGSRKRSDFPGGAVSVVDLETGNAQVLAQRPDWEAIDGIVWTPWNTLLVGEETNTAVLPDPQAPNARHGLVYEIALADHTGVKSISVRPMIGSMAHEGVELDARGNAYVVDEFAAGGIYKFVPDRYGDLSSGDLYVLALDSENREKTGPANWLKLDRDAVQLSARQAAAAGATGYGRPEDLERIGDTLFVAVTSEHRVLAISLDGKPHVTTFVDGALADTTTASLRNVDNLANGPDGRLWIVEDNVPSDIWVADPDGNRDGRSDRVRLFASFNDGAAEGSGIYFGKDPQSLFVNVQHAANGNDRTILISRLPCDDDPWLSD